ncbi:MAG: YhdH/YhfP family quinone oxidoreductase [Pseudomonadota bacterium]
MPDKFNAFRIHAKKEFESAGIEELSLDDLSPGEVTIQVKYSSINYKDALAGTGKGKILRTSPLNGGIDLAGVVKTSSSEAFTEGQSVLVNGSGLSEVHDGGYSKYARVPADWVVPMPKGLDARTAMILGTAGFTAALALQRLQDNHQSPQQGPVLITGATGGVGSFAIQLLSQQGYEVVAMTRKNDQVDYLKTLGAAEIIHPDEVINNKTPLYKGCWGGAIDNLGGETLAWLTKCVKPWGNIVSIGMAGGVSIETTTMPFILRAVSVLGVASAACPQPMRKTVWSKLGSEWRPQYINQICAGEVSLKQLPETFEKVLAGDHIGRYIVCI